MIATNENVQAHNDDLDYAPTLRVAIKRLRQLLALCEWALKIGDQKEMRAAIRTASEGWHWR